MNNKNLKSIDELSEAINGYSPQYNIPSYQRGYRWDKTQVEALLNDIYEAELQIGDIYCLQPIVVMQKENTHIFDIIDGQQRLTTIYLILKYIGCDEDELFQLTYYRDDGKDIIGKFLRELKSKKNIKDEIKNKFTENLNKQEKFNKITEYIDSIIKNAGNIDQEYIAKAYKVIHEWSGTDYKCSKLERKIRDNTCVIWHEVDKENENPIEVFNRLNIGKIPLTDAELIKALFLKKSNFKLSKASNDDAKQYEIQKLEEKIYRNKQFQIANEWDTIEKNLQNDSLWYFLSNEDKRYNRIELIFDLMSDKQQNIKDEDSHHTYRYFNNLLQNKYEETAEEIKNKEEKLNKNVKGKGCSTNEVWEKVIQNYYLLSGWRADRELYHYIGYLITTKQATLKDIYEEYYKTHTKSDFIKNLQQIIYNKILTTVDGEIDIETLTYEDENSGKNKKQISNVLLLHNILTILNNDELNSEFPFDKYKKVACDVEHISPTNIKKAPEKKEEKIKLLNTQLEYFKGKDQYIIKGKIEEYKEMKNIDGDEYSIFYTENILNYFNKGLIANDLQQNIANLVLLNKEINRKHEYSNALFPTKREILIDYDQNYRYIPLCTKNAFLKYYDRKNSNNDPFRWTQTNAIAYRQDIIDKINNFKNKIKDRVKND